MAAEPPKQGQILEIVAGAWAAEGSSRCLLDSGWELRVFGLIPKERCEVEVTHVSGGGRVAWGIPRSIRGPHNARRDPPCLQASSCGACGLLHVDDEHQFRLKVESAKQSLPDELVSQMVGQRDWVTSPQPFAYRHKAVFLPEVIDGRLELGGYARGTHNVVPLPRCEVISPALVEARNSLQQGLEADVLNGDLALRALVLRANRSGEVLVTIIVRHPPETDTAALAEHLLVASSRIRGVHLQLHDVAGDSVTGSGPVVHLAGAQHLHENVLGQPFLTRPLSFFQVNPAVLEGIILLLRRRLTSSRTSPASGSSPDSLLDLYCGGGVLGLATLAGRPEWKLTGIDTTAANILDARENAVLTGQPEATFQRGRVEDLLGDTELEHASAAIIDPPRSGLRPAALEALARRGPDQLIYVACSTKALARDAQVLLRGGYTAAVLCPADMMPQTPYVEWVAGFQRTPESSNSSGAAGV